MKRGKPWAKTGSLCVHSSSEQKTKSLRIDLAVLTLNLSHSPPSSLEPLEFLTVTKMSNISPEDDRSRKQSPFAPLRTFTSDLFQKAKSILPSSKPHASTEQLHQVRDEQHPPQPSLPDFVKGNDVRPIQGQELPVHGHLDVHPSSHLHLFDTLTKKAPVDLTHIGSDTTLDMDNTADMSTYPATDIPSHNPVCQSLHSTGTKRSIDIEPAQGSDEIYPKEDK